MDNWASNKTSDIVSAIQVLHRFASQELSKLIKDSDNFIIQLQAENGSSILVDMEKVASSLPLHLIAVLLSTDSDKKMGHLLLGLRVLHTFSDLATRHARLEQILLDDVKLSEQIIDLVFFTLIILAHHKQENHLGAAPLLHSTIVACSLNLLTGFLSSQWHELAYVLLAHPKIDIFIDVAFDSLHEDIRILDGNLKALKNEEVLLDTSTAAAAQRTVHYICQQCEASMQFLLSLCQQKLFRDRVLKNKELCKQGGILSLAQTVLQLNVPTLGCSKEPSDIVASVSRLKAKILSILLQLCEAESISYLDEVAGSPKSMCFAQSVVLQFLELLRTSLRREDNNPCDSQDRSIPMGLVLLNTLRLADIFSDDSNFRSFFMKNSVPVLAPILAVPYEEFTSTWCSSKIAIVEEDANIEYDLFTAAGVTLVALNGIIDNDQSTPVRLNETTSACLLNIIGLPSATYAQQRTSCLVKIIANLHVFVPNICEEEERDMFLNKFFNYLILETRESHVHCSSSILQKTSTVCRNLSSLSQYAKSLIPNFLNDEDVQLVSVYADKLQKLTHTYVEDSLAKDKHEVGISSYTLKKPDESSVDTPNLSSNSVDLKIVPKETTVHGSSTKLNGSVGSENEVENYQTKGVDNFPGKMEIEATPDGNEKLKSEPTKESEQEIQDSGQNEEKLPRKRKRNIMNELQINLIEKALVDEPEMQKNALLLQSWADKLSSQGSEITSSQLKNWLNNRKARLARAAKEARAPSEGETSVPDKSSGPSNLYDSPESASEENYAPPTRVSQAVTKSGGMITRSASCEDPEMITPTDLARRNRQNGSSNRSASFEPGQLALLVDEGGKSVAKGKIFQIDGSWHGRSLEGVTCIVDVIELKVDRSNEVQHPSDVAGRTFEEAAVKNAGIMRVAWDTTALYPIPQ